MLCVYFPSPSLPYAKRKYRQPFFRKEEATAFPHMRNPMCQDAFTPLSCAMQRHSNPLPPEDKNKRNLPARKFHSGLKQRKNGEDGSMRPSDMPPEPRKLFPQKKTTGRYTNAKKRNKEFSMPLARLCLPDGRPAWLRPPRGKPLRIAPLSRHTPRKRTRKAAIRRTLSLSSFILFYASQRYAYYSEGFVRESLNNLK